MMGVNAPSNYTGHYSNGTVNNNPHLKASVLPQVPTQHRQQPSTSIHQSLMNSLQRSQLLDSVQLTQTPIRPPLPCQQTNSALRAGAYFMTENSTPHPMPTSSQSLNVTQHFGSGIPPPLDHDLLFGVMDHKQLVPQSQSHQTRQPPAPSYNPSSSSMGIPASVLRTHQPRLQHHAHSHHDRTTSSSRPAHSAPTTYSTNQPPIILINQHQSAPYFSSTNEQHLSRRFKDIFTS